MGGNWAVIPSAEIAQVANESLFTIGSEGLPVDGFLIKLVKFWLRVVDPSLPGFDAARALKGWAFFAKATEGGSVKAGRPGGQRPESVDGLNNLESFLIIKPLDGA